MSLRRAIELARTMANVARSRSNKWEAIALDHFADELDHMEGEEVTARARVILCRKCGSIVAGELVTSK
jgi:hypothetical protein